MIGIIFIGLVLCGLLYSVFGNGAFVFFFLYLLVATPIYYLAKRIFNKKD